MILPRLYSSSEFGKLMDFPSQLTGKVPEYGKTNPSNSATVFFISVKLLPDPSGGIFASDQLIIS